MYHLLYILGPQQREADITECQWNSVITSGVLLLEVLLSHPPSLLNTLPLYSQWDLFPWDTTLLGLSLPFPLWHSTKTSQLQICQSPSSFMKLSSSLEPTPEPPSSQCHASFTAQDHNHTQGLLFHCLKGSHLTSLMILRSLAGLCQVILLMSMKCQGKIFFF